MHTERKKQHVQRCTWGSFACRTVGVPRAWAIHGEAHKPTKCPCRGIMVTRWIKGKASWLPQNCCPKKDRNGTVGSGGQNLCLNGKDTLACTHQLRGKRRRALPEARGGNRLITDRSADAS
jgi:hypothetical protein